MPATRRTLPIPLTLPTEWPYWAGGIALAIINTAVLALIGRPWGVTGPITNLGGQLLQRLGIAAGDWAYFRSPDIEQTFRDFDLLNGMLWLGLGAMLGALIASLTAGEFRIRLGRKGWQTPALAVTGGILMGYGTRLSLGCNAGALLGGIPSFSLHGWVFLAAAVGGVLLGLRIFRRSL